MVKNTKAKFLLIGLLVGLVAAAAFTIVERVQAASHARGRKTHVVVIRNSAFSPANLTVNVGDRVVWRNEDVVPHTATGSGFDSGNLEKGQTWSYTVPRKGTLSYICTYHPSMKGRISAK